MWLLVVWGYWIDNIACLIGTTGLGLAWVRKEIRRVDAYIKKAAPFAQPILTEIRETCTRACPDVEETMKWSFPHFVYKGVLCCMASFKAHAAFGFWKGSLVTGGPRSVDAMGHFGRITKRSDLPSKAGARRLRQEGGGAERAGREGAARAEEGRAEDGEGAGRSRRGAQEATRRRRPASTR